MSYDRVISFRPDTASNWATNNPVLSQGEGAIETDTGIIKIGDGVNAYNDLSAYKFPTIDSSNNMVLTPESGGQVEAEGQLSITGVSRIRAYASTSITFPDSTTTTVPIDTVIYDNLSEFNTSTHTATITKSGYYLIGAALMLNSGSWSNNKRLVIYVTVNGTQHAAGIWRAQGSNTVYAYANGTVQLYLDAGDTVKMEAYQNSGGSLTNTATEGYADFVLHRLS